MKIRWEQLVEADWTLHRFWNTLGKLRLAKNFPYYLNGSFHEACLVRLLSAGYDGGET
jgi:hypothetical protein